MPAYSFMPQFIEPIRAGTKGGTIRAERRIRPADRTLPRPGGHARAGEPLYLYCRQRHPSGFLMGRERCLASEPIHLNFDWDRVETRDDNHAFVVLMGQQLDPFARFDGFGGWEQMRHFWLEMHHTREFDGWHIRWLPLPFSHDEAAHAEASDGG